MKVSSVWAVPFTGKGGGDFVGHCRVFRPAGAVTPVIRPCYEYHADHTSGLFDRIDVTERTNTHKAENQNHGAGGFLLKDGSFVVPPAGSLALLRVNFILGCWRGR